MSDEQSCCRQVFNLLSHAICYLIAVSLLGLIYYLTNPDPSPRFTLDDLKLYAFNVSTSTSTLTSTLHINISCRDADRYDSGFHFDKLDVYASYKNQQITPPTTIPSTYLFEQEVWSTYLVGFEVPVRPDLAASLARDETAGNMLINVEVTGQYSSTQHLSPSYGSSNVPNWLNVTCPAYIMFGNKNDSNVVGAAVKHPFVKVEGCHDS